MKIERVRSVLGVWAPMAIALLILITSVNFFFNADLPEGLESWRLACSAGAMFVGAVLILSTYGRYTKAKEARQEATVSLPSTSSPAPMPHERPNDERDRGDQNGEPRLEKTD